MKKYDYLAKYTFFNSKSQFNVHWWSKNTTDYHCHTDFYEMFLVLDDGLVQLYNGTLIPLEKGALYFIPIKQYHRIDYLKKEEHLIIFNMSVLPHFFEQNIETYSSDLLNDIKKTECLCVRLEDSAFNFLLMLAKLATHDDDDTRRLQSVRLFLATAATLYQSAAIPETAMSQPHRYALDVKQKIDSLVYIDFKISDIYSKYPLSPSLLIKAFKELTGQTIVCYQVERRMKYASSLLINTDDTVLRIASATGYDSLSHFIANFKKYTGLSPSQFRKENAYN